MGATRRMPGGDYGDLGDLGGVDPVRDPVEAALDELEMRFLLDPETTLDREDDGTD